MSQHHFSITSLLSTLLEVARCKQHLSLHDIIEHMDSRVFGVLLLILALPNTLPIPTPPGSSGLTGIPIILLGLQILAGRAAPWLPRRILYYQVSFKWCECITVKSARIMHRIEKLLHPRLEWISQGIWMRAVGGLIVLLGTLLSLPIPFGNILPSVPIAIMALGIIEKDGYFIATGALTGIIVAIAMPIFWGEVIMKIFTYVF